MWFFRFFFVCLSLFAGRLLFVMSVICFVVDELVFLVYCVVGGVVIVFGDLIGLCECLYDVIAGFVEYAHAWDWCIAILGVFEFLWCVVVHCNLFEYDVVFGIEFCERGCEYYLVYHVYCRFELVVRDVCIDKRVLA